ncbi:MAG: GDSL-type esterase/lipase family protein [Candidatus Woesearchaeota archaeon]
MMLIVLSLINSALGNETSITQATAEAKECKNLQGIQQLPDKIEGRDVYNSLNIDTYQQFLDRIRPYEQFIREASDKYDIEPELIRAVMYIESGGNVYAGGSLCNPSGYCSLMQTKISKCAGMPDSECDVEKFKAGSSKDSIFAGTSHLKWTLGVYNNFINKVTDGKLPRYNDYWIVSMAYHDGVGSMATALKTLVDLKYSGDYSRFKWWEITLEDYKAVKLAFLNNKNSVGNKKAEVLWGYPTTIMKILSLENFKDCGGIGTTYGSTSTKISSIDTSKETAATLKLETIPKEISDDFVYQIRPSFSVYLIHDLDIYAKLREKAFLIAKDVEKCHEDKKETNIDGKEPQLTSKQLWDQCIDEKVKENIALNLPPLLKLSVCHKDDKKPLYVLCAQAIDTVFVKDNDEFSDKNLVYRFALGFTKASLESKTIKDVKKEMQEPSQTAKGYNPSTIPANKRKIGVFGTSTTVAGSLSYGYITKLNDMNAGNFKGFAKVGAATNVIQSLFYKTLEDEKFDEVIINAGANDICYRLSDLTKELQEMYTYAKKSKGMRVGAVTIAAHKGYGTWTSECYDNTNALNRWIMTEAKDVDFTADVFEAMKDQDNPEQIEPTLTSDKIHANAKGHTIIADTIYNAGYKTQETGINAGCSSDRYIPLVYPNVLEVISDSVHEDYKFKPIPYKIINNNENPNIPKNMGYVWIPKEACGKSVDLLIALHGWRSLSEPGSSIYLNPPGQTSKQKDFDKITREYIDSGISRPIVIAAPMHDKGPDMTVWSSDVYDVNEHIKKIEQILAQTDTKIRTVSILGHSNANCGSGLERSAKEISKKLYLYASADGTCGGLDYIKGVIPIIKSKNAILFHMIANRENPYSGDIKSQASIINLGTKEDTNAYLDVYKNKFVSYDNQFYTYETRPEGHTHTTIPGDMLREILPRFFKPESKDMALT